MPVTDTLQPKNFVLFKSKPAIITGIDDKKVELTTPYKSGLKVRHKDVSLIHPGPVSSLTEIKPVSGDVEEACELLSGETTTIPEFAEIIFGGFSPSGAWKVVELLLDGFYCSGTVEDIKVHTQEERDSIAKKRKENAAKKEEWEYFLARLRSGSLADGDMDKLSEVEEVALRRSVISPILNALGIPCSHESAHQFLLRLGVWNETRNPYPDRFGLPVSENMEVQASQEEERLDLTHLQAFAIDDEGNMDPDDAISIEGNVIWVHVADVSSVVGPESRIDLKARELGSTIYLPEEVRHMLPQEVTKRTGMGLQEISPSLSFGIKVNEDGKIDEVEIHTAKVKVTRLSYGAAEKKMGEPPFSEIAALTGKYREYRKSQNAAFINFPEVKVIVEDGDVSIRELPGNNSRRMVSEAMIMAGESAAKFGIERNIPLPFNSQNPPEACESPQDLAAMYAYRRKLKPGKISIEPLPHCGLGLKYYCKATSPLRRYGDLLAHQQLRAFLKNQELMSGDQLLLKIGSSQTGSAAISQAERLSNTHWKLVYLMRNPQWFGTGIIVAKKERFDEIIIPELGMEAKIMTGEDLELNSEIKIKCVEIDIPRLYVRFKKI